MELVEDDVGRWQVGLDGGAAGSAAIDADRDDAGFLLRAQLGEEAFEGVLAAPLGQPEQFAGARVEHEGDEARAAQVFFVNEQRLQSVETRLGQLGLEDIAIVAVGAGRRHRHHLADPLHRQPPAEQADVAHQTQRGQVLFDDAERAHRFIACAVPAKALHRLVEHAHKARRPQRQVQGTLPGLAV